MNLCGGISGVTEHEMAFRFPDEEFSVSSRKKKSSSSSSLPGRRERSTNGRPSLRRQSSSSSRHSSRTSRGSIKATSNQSLASISSASTPKPVSRLDHEKQRTRNRSHLRRETKSSSILTRKLESGFNVTWINGGSKPQVVNLSTNSDKSYLRISMRSRDEEESENDGSKANRRDMKFKVRHIAKVGSDTDSTSSKSSQNKYFVIKMKYNIGEFSKFKFLAQSLAERDSVLLAIRSLIGDQVKHQTNSAPSKSRPIEYIMRIDDEVGVKSNKVLKGNEHRNRLVMEETDSLIIPAPKRFANPVDNKRCPIDSRDDDDLGRGRRIGKTERDTAEVFDRSKQRNSIQREKVFGKAYTNNATHKLTTSQNISTSTKLNRNKPSARMEKKDVHNSNGTKKIIVRSQKNRQHQSSLSLNHNKQRSRSPRMLEHQRNLVGTDKVKFTMNEQTDHLPYEQYFACNPIGCQSQALSALENGAIGNIAADFTNPAAGLWCTDDVCTASLKDFADSMTGIFDLKDSRNMKGANAAKKNQRATAEEYISGFLSKNSNMSELLSVKDLWNVAATKHATGKEIKKRRLHNRARISNAKATRFMNLRKQMTFQGADDEDNTILQTVSSFDDIKNRQGNADMDDCGGLLYYDSDPEGARECTLTKGPRVAIARRKVRSNKSNAKRREALDILDSSRFGLGRKWKRLGRDVLSDIIEATKNEKLILLWHPTQNKENNNVPPVCVKVWVESGVYLTDGSFLLPKLTWLPAYEKSLNHRVLNVSDNSPGSLDLLDVCRVRECQSIDRRLHPFAQVDRSFTIQTQNGMYMFEAQSKQERGRVVNGLKLVIARLASLLMLKDLRAVDEFFGGNAVPGEAPVWARGCENSESDVDFPPTMHR